MIGSLAGFRAWAAARGHAAVASASDADATAALVRASDHILYAYLPRFAAGYDAASPNVEPAAYEAAALELATPGFFARTYTPGERKVLVGVGDIRWQVVGDASGGATPVSTRVEAMLAPYMLLPVGVFVA